MKQNALSALAVWMFLFGMLSISQDALPSDFLYPIKTEVNERIMSMFTLGTQAEAELQLRFIEERKLEIAAMRTGYTHSPKALFTFSEQLKENRDSLEKLLQELEEVSDPSFVQELRNSYRTIIQAIETIYISLETNGDVLAE